jgi:NAD(P)H-dependent FMN reductase
MPEYNFFAPPSMVNALDYLSNEWSYKPAGLVGYGGVSGGLRAVQAVKPLITSMRMMPLPESVAMPMVHSLVGEDGELKSNDLIDASAKTMLGELAKWAGALKPLRG